MSAHACLHSQLSNSTHFIHTGICWRCNCTPETLRDVGLDADWRASRRKTWDLLRALRANGITTSPLFDVPWVVVEIFKMDWLHCVDQGVAATHLGNIFWIQIKRKEAGNNIKGESGLVLGADARTPLCKCVHACRVYYAKHAHVHGHVIILRPYDPSRIIRRGERQ